MNNDKNYCLINNTINLSHSISLVSISHGPETEDVDRAENCCQPAWEPQWFVASPRAGRFILPMAPVLSFQIPRFAGGELGGS